MQYINPENSLRLFVSFLSAVAAVGIAGLFFSATAQEVDTDPEDAIIIAYHLTEAEEAMFSRTDGKASDFWATWTDQSLDYIHMNPITHETWMKEGNHEFFAAGEDDAQMHVQLAWGEKGLYLLMEVEDDNFSDIIVTHPKGLTEFYGTAGDRTAEEENDAIEMRICQQSTEELINGDHATLFATDSAGVPKNCNPQSLAWYSMRFGGELPDPDVEIFRKNPSYDPTVEDTGDWTVSREYLWERPAIEDEAPAMGIYIEVLGGTTKRAMEWLIAWNQIGVEGAFVKPTEGKQIAAFWGYHDVDAGYEFARGDWFYWQRALSRWPYPGGLVAWGDIYFGGPLATADPIPVLQRNRMLSTRQSRETTGRYSLTGRAMTDNRAIGMVLERSMGDAGRCLVRF